jgi:hypothetical protein
MWVKSLGEGGLRLEMEADLTVSRQIGAASTYLQLSSDSTYITYIHLGIYNVYTLYHI